MRYVLPLLLVLAACKGGGDDTGALDADGDGVSADLDCDDNDAARFPGNEELCDGVDNDCDEVVDNGAADALDWYADADSDGYGAAGSVESACEAPSGYVSDDTDCDDSDPDVSPIGAEICDGLDNDCDGLVDDADDSVDLATGESFWADGDGDGFGDAAVPTRACVQPSGFVDNELDCDDLKVEVNPAAAEVCDGLDNNCDGQADEGVLGDDVECAAESCAQLKVERPALGDGEYWIDPSATDAFLASCDMSTDGGGWTLIAWTEDSTQSTADGLVAGVPYPGLVVCDTLDCARGSSATEERLELVIQGAEALAVGHTTSAISGFAALGDYEYASAYVYDDLSGLVLEGGASGSCDSAGLTGGTVQVLAGDVTYEGTVVFLSQGFRYASYTYDEGSAYIWNMANTSPCSGSGSAPAVFLGNWSSSEGEYGPYLAGSTGARSVWAR